MISFSNNTPNSHQTKVKIKVIIKHIMTKISSVEYYEKVLGSWEGRIAGDYVGAPVEFKSHEQILDKYGDITYFPEPIDLNYVNDDEMYEICALIALEKKGINLNAKDIAFEWENLLYDLNFTAEKTALNNLRLNIWPPQSGLHNNIYFDAIGAQMRADIWGQIAPGAPSVAKKYAEMDGSISHAGIGIEGEIYIAVLISNAFTEQNIRTNIEKSLPHIPPPTESLYSQMVRKAIQIYDYNPADFRNALIILIRYWEDIRKNVLQITGVKGSKSDSLLARKRKLYLRDNSSVHVLPNIGIIILSLLYGSEDKSDPLGRSICIAAMMGFDTDCNCGNIGAILGTQLSSKNIPSKWREPLQNTFSTHVKGYERWKITELALRIMEIGKKVIQEKQQEIIFS